ncbi:MAG: FkbM family methyltransferase [Alphaproteobacteria bacterium]|nr:FkbM family methyltransferase [Alphaproteobacteria bacterium]MBO6626882.1 FkbM family methyltransferase [Alphaproteobacteria bacterium]MDF1627649.1 FkbM family methyltransferase [Parvibaculaceae bacterium]
MIRKLLSRIDIGMRARRIFKQSLGGHGEIELSLLSVLMRANSLSIDIGANKGVYTYQMKEWGRTVAFEPIPELANNLSAAAYPDLTVEQCALCEKPGMTVLHVPYHAKKKGKLNTPSATLRDDSTSNPLGFREIHVPAKTLDSFQFEDVGFVKIDVEGWEENVLMGGRETIRRNQPIVMAELVETYTPGILTRVPAFFADLNYQGFCIDAAALKLMKIEDIDPAQPVTENYIFVPGHDAEAFRSRCQALLRQRA